jgi:peptidoglycan/LPS O-acetylase OafA/YrhL
VATRPHLTLALPLGLYTVIAISAATIILKILEMQLVRKSLKPGNPLVYTGRISYGVYLWHFPIYAIAVPMLFRMNIAPIISLVILFVLVFAVSTLSYYLVEQPFLRLKSKFSLMSRPPQAAQLHCPSN